jgi:four helix bundle suffix protein
MRQNTNTLLPTHGGYRNLKSFQTTTIIEDLTVIFCKRFIVMSRQTDQMVQAARSGRQNIAEGSKASATSRETEIKLTNVARASLEELLLDYEDYLRQHNLPIWDKNDPRVLEIRKIAYRTNRSHLSYLPYCTTPESFANTIICLIRQANYLLDHQLQSQSQTFLEQGGFRERMFNKRKEYRNKTNRTDWTNRT